MKLAQRVRIDMLEVLRTGRFAGLYVGQTKQEVLAGFPDPDGWTPDDASFWLRDSTNIWSYGEIELHFEGSRLVRVFSDYVNSLHGDPSLDVDPWIFGRDPAPNVKQTLGALGRESLPFTRGAREGGSLRVALASGVELLFEQPSDRAEPNDELLQLVTFTLRGA